MHNLYTSHPRRLSGDIFYTHSKRRSPLLASLIAHWRLNESSGIRGDSHAGLDLADINTVGSAAGKLNNAASFIAANEESLDAADSPALSMGNFDFTIAGWVWFDTVDSTGLAGKWSTLSLEYIVYCDGTNLRFYASSNGTNAFFVTNTHALSTSTWYFFVAWHDAAADTINLSINNNAAASAAHSLGVHDGNAGFHLGQNEEGLTYLNGRLDSVSVWKRLLSANERTQLYNAGLGLDYPFA